MRLPVAFYRKREKWKDKQMELEKKKRKRKRGIGFTLPRRSESPYLAMTAECSKWKFKKGTFFPEKLVCWKEDGEKIDPFYSFLKNGQHI